jgi:hypothetical protein
LPFLSTFLSADHKFEQRFAGQCLIFTSVAALSASRKATAAALAFCEKMGLWSFSWPIARRSVALNCFSKFLLPELKIG